MPDRVNSWSRVTTWIKVPIIVGVVVVLVWQLWRFIPLMVERKVQSTLLEDGIVASDFPVRQVGLRGLSVGPGTLLLDSNTLQWENLDVRYNVRDMLSGQVEELFLDRPVVSFYLQPLPLPASEAALPVEPAPPESAPAPEPTPPGPVAGGEGAPPTRPDVEKPSPEVPPAKPAPAPPTLRDQLLGLPLNLATASNGRLDLMLDQEPFLEWTLNGQLQRKPFGTTVELILDNDWMGAQVALRVPANQQLLTLQADAVMAPGALGILENKLTRFFPGLESMPQVVSSGPFTLDFLAEFPSSGAPYGSGEASAESLALRFSFLQADLVLDRFMVAGTLRDQRLDLQGGAEVLPLKVDDFSSQTFGMRFSLNPEGILSVETEAIDWVLGDISGNGALRGTTSSLTDGTEPEFRLEASLARLDLKDLQVDPFSILGESKGPDLRLSSSAIALVRDATLWVEQLVLNWNFETRSGKGSLDWFNLAGKPMGKVRGSLRQAQPDRTDAAYELVDPEGRTFLKGTFLDDGKRVNLSAGGQLLPSWINALNQWWKVLPGKMKGTAPELELQLGGLFPFLHGSARIDFSGTGLEMDNGLLLEDIESDVRLLVSTLPRSDGPQVTRIGKLRSGAIVLEDVSFKWDLPHIRSLQVLELSGNLESGRLWLDPFTIDPMKPGFQTVLNFESVDGNLLMELLGEDRFTIQGTVSGHMDLGWADDALVISKGSLTMDASTGTNRFIFSDPAFLREKFAAFTGVPAELRERFLEALLQDGIVIDRLVADLGSSGDENMILLRLSISGESRTDRLQVPIRELVINNLISAEDLAELIGVFGTLKIRAAP